MVFASISVVSARRFSFIPCSGATKEPKPSPLASLLSLPKISRCFMAQPDSGIGNVTPNAALVQMAMAYFRSQILCAAARLGVADALGDETRGVDHQIGRAHV